MEAINIIISVLSYIGTALTILTLYKVIFFLVGIFKKKRYPEAKQKHIYGLCIAARNEEKVIKNLLDSISNQDYPKERLCVFVVADNCTDNTAQIVRDYDKSKLNVVVYEHNNPDERTKGYALRYLFDQIKKDFGIELFDGYFIFDADNVLQKDYVSKMNDAFDDGNKIITSFRKSKNMNQNWISFAYAMHWLRTCLLENRAKAVLNQACRIQGTGFLFSNELVRDGWNYVTLTEDRSFCSDAVVQNYRIVYCEDAVFYDEQPYNLKVSCRQRIRWAKGHYQSFAENEPKLLKNMFRKNKYFPTTYDCFWLNFPSAAEGAVRRILTRILTITLAFLACDYWGGVKGLLIFYASYIFKAFLSGVGLVLLVLICYRKQLGKMPVWKTIWHTLLFFLFDIIGNFTYYIALFTKVEWKPIPHDTVMEMDKLDNQNK